MKIKNNFNVIAYFLVTEFIIDKKTVMHFIFECSKKY